MRFENKVVIVTGANSSYGKAIATQFTTEGASVVLVGKNEDKLKSLKRICDATENTRCPAFVVTADLTEDEETESVINQTIEKFGKIDILVNNAEVVRNGRLFDRSILDSFDEVMDVNIRAVVSLTSYATPHLIRTKGCIVNISSIGAERILKNNCISYFISKAALNHFTKACAMELGKCGVRVNTVSPGSTSSRYFKYSTCVETRTEMEEVADLVLHVASDKSNSITGSNFVCDSGNLTAYVYYN